jgi:chromosome segregation ATPase
MSSTGAGGTVVVTGENIPTQKEKEQKDEFVRKTAYEEVTSDMHRFKSRAKDAEAKAAEYEAKLRAIEDEKLKSEQRYQELYEKEKREKEQLADTRKKERELYLRGLKLGALKSELGNVKDAYLMHADISAIEINEDGTLNSESVRKVANQFRQEHAALIPSQAGSNITNFASPTSFNPKAPKSINDMSYAEKAAYLQQLKKNKQE